MKKNDSVPQRPRGHHQAYQHMDTGSTRRREKKAEKKTLEEMLAENFSNLMQNINLHIQEGQ